MPLNARLPLLPPDAEVVSDSLAVHDDGALVTFYNAAGPIFCCERDDRAGLRLGAVIVIDQGLAGIGAVAEVLSLHRTTLFRAKQRFAKEGVEGLIEKRRGPKGPHRLTAEVRRKAQDLLDRGETLSGTAAAVGMSSRGLRHAVDRGLLVRPQRGATKGPADEVTTMVSSEKFTRPQARAARDQQCELGVATTREVERMAAAVGTLEQAEPRFHGAEAVPNAGALLALPALLEQSLLEVGAAVYGRLRDAYFGLNSILLTFAFMALLRIKTPEQLTEHAPGELGVLLGLDRIPEVKTLRRKLRELAERGLADLLKRKFAEHWTEAEPRELAILYVDGHVRPYHGRVQSLPRLHVQQRGRPMPGTKDFYVNNRRADPLLFVTAEATESLLAALDSVLLPEIRRLVGDQRRVTITFDREGWSPEHFARWQSEGFDVLTYRKGEQTRWRKKSFEEVTGRVGGEKVEYNLAEREVKLSNGLRVREIRRLTDDGHQTAVVTTNRTLSTLAIAHRMFSRWRQENFFRYMRHEFALDHLCTNDVEPADPERLVAHPGRKELEKKRGAARAAKTKLVERGLEMAPGEKVRVGKRRVGEEELAELIRARDLEIERLTGRIARLPKRVPIGELLQPENVVRLERERKVIVDAIKLCAYRAESALARVLGPLFPRHDEEARKLLKSIFRATADVVPDQKNRRLTVRFHGLSNPRSTRTLVELCEVVNENAPEYPGTDLTLHFEAPRLQESSR